MADNAGEAQADEPVKSTGQLDVARVVHSAPVVANVEDVALAILRVADLDFGRANFLSTGVRQELSNEVQRVGSFLYQLLEDRDFAEGRIDFTRCLRLQTVPEVVERH